MDQLAAVRRARFAVAAIFLANGVITGTWAAHIPLVEERLGISHATLGLTLFAMAAGAIVAMPLSGPLIGRFGSAAITRAAAPMLVAGFLLPILAPNPILLMVALFALGAANGTMDVAMNAHGVAVEAKLKRAVMSSFHGMWSLGGLVGAGVAALLLPRMPAVAQAALIVACLLVFTAVALLFLLPADADRGAQGPALAWPSRATIGLGVLCFLAMTSEGAVVDWAALHLKGSLKLGAGLAATGFAVYSAAMALSRFTGDRLRNRFGAGELVRASAVIAALGLVVAISVPVPAVAIAGFALVGLGLANLVPVFFGAAGRMPGRAGTSIAAVATIGYSGFVVGPPLIGFVADLTSLTIALSLVVLACITVAAGAGFVEPKRRAASAPGRGA